MRIIAIAVALLATTAFAAGRPRVAVLPLKSSIFNTPKDREKLALEFELLVAAGKNIDQPSTDDVQRAVASRGTCERDDTCLRSIADATESVYALAVTISLNVADDKFALTARVVRADGEVVRSIPQQLAPTSGETRLLAAKNALKDLLVQLKLGDLPTTIPARPVVKDVPPPIVINTPPPVNNGAPPIIINNNPPPEKTSTLRKLSYAAGGVALIAAGVGAGLALSAQSDAALATSLGAGTGTIPQSRVGLLNSIDAKSTGATIAFIGAGVVAAGAVTMFVLGGNDASAPSVAAVAVPGAGAWAGVTVPLP